MSGAAAGAGSPTTRRGLLAAAIGAGSHADAPVLVAMLRRVQLTVFSYAHGSAEIALGVHAGAVLGRLAAHERAHAAALGRAVRRAGAAAPAPPASTAAANAAFARDEVSGRLGQLRGEQDLLNLLLDLERLAVGAGYAALIALRAPAHARLAASIMASDAQHEALLGELLNPGDIAAVIRYGLVAGLQ